jgi:hypothetical protein
MRRRGSAGFPKALTIDQLMHACRPSWTPSAVGLIREVGKAHVYPGTLSEHDTLVV